MAIRNEMMMDAAASVETAAMMSAGDTFNGSLSTKNDEDWIRVELTAGMVYTISLSGAAMGGSADTILKLFDSKGGHIMTNDDKDGAKGDLNSELEFTPEESGTYYISASAYTGNPGQDNSGDYTVTVTAMDPPDPTMGKAITGTKLSDKLTGTDAGETIDGGDGDDSLYGGAGDDTLVGGADNMPATDTDNENDEDDGTPPVETGGNDLLVGGPGADTLMGGDGVDTISYGYSMAGVTINLTDGTARGGNAEGDTIVDMGEDRIENVIGSEHDDAITGNRYANSIWGRGGNDELDGLRGNDMLFGGSGDDELDGGRGDDTLEGGYGADVLTGGDGDDTASYAGSMMGVTVRLHNSKAMGGDAKGDTFGATVEATYTDKDKDEITAMLPDIMNLTGSANADVLAGDFRDNTIMGGGGDDKIYGGPDPKNLPMDRGDVDNDDTLMGEGGNDMIFGGGGDDTLDGGAGNDMLVGGGGADTYRGGAGSDMIYADAMDVNINGFGPEDDTDTTDVNESIDDPMDVDTLSYAMVSNEDETGITADISATNENITNIENIVGSDYDDTLTGDAQDNVIEGGDGGDDLDGGAHGDGGDTLSYANSDGRVTVTLVADAEAETSRAHASRDTAENFENVTGSAYDDRLTGDVNANVLKGGAGDDEIVGDAGADTVEGGAGADEMDGDDGNDTADEDREAAANNADVLSYAGSDAGVTVNLATASASGGHATGDTIVTYEVTIEAEDDDDDDIDLDVSTFEYVTGSMHDDSLTGDHRNNHLVGMGGDDNLRGGAGMDVLVGGPGADMLDGGEDEDEKDNMIPGIDLNDDGDFDDTDEVAPVAASIDWAVYRGAKDAVTVDLSTNRGTGGDAMGDTLVNIELVWGSMNAGDTFIAGPGADIIEGDGGSDTVSYEASEMGVRVDLSADGEHRTAITTGDGTEASPFVFIPDPDPDTVTQPATGVQPRDAMGVLLTDEDGVNPETEDNPNANGARGDKLGSIENLTGSAQDDMLTGDENPNVLKGMGGGDTLNGGGNDDKLYGGDGADMLNGDADDDMLMGGAGDDTLNGGGDDDTLTGGAGDDDLSGGTGSDTFVFSTADSGDSDAILDWDQGTGNQIDLSAFDLTAEQVIGAITLRGSGGEAYIVINLEEFGGGRITIDNISDLDALDAESVTGEGDTDDTINELSVGDEGIFIL